MKYENEIGWIPTAILCHIIEINSKIEVVNGNLINRLTTSLGPADSISDKASYRPSVGTTLWGFESCSGS